MYHQLGWGRLLGESSGKMRERVIYNPGTHKLIVPDTLKIIWIDACGGGGGAGGGSAGAGAGSGGGAAMACHQLPVRIPTHVGDIALYVTVPDASPGGDGGAIGTAGANGTAGDPLTIRLGSPTGVILLKLDGGVAGLGAPTTGAGAASQAPNVAYANGSAGGLSSNGNGVPGPNHSSYWLSVGIAGCFLPGGSAGSGGGWSGTGTGGTGGASGYFHNGMGNAGVEPSSALGASGGAGGWCYAMYSGIAIASARGGPPLGSAADVSSWYGVQSCTAKMAYIKGFAYSDAVSPGGGGGGGGSGVKGGHGGRGWCRITW
jgi:hypothetical protein